MMTRVVETTRKKMKRKKMQMKRHTHGTSRRFKKVRDLITLARKESWMKSKPVNTSDIFCL